MKITIRLWILIAFIIFALISIFSIPPTFLEKGVFVKSVEQNSTIFDQGLRKSMIITSINNQQINNIQDYSNVLASIFKNNSNNQIKLDIQTKDTEIIGLFSKEVLNQVVVSDISKTRIKTGLDITGGARALVSAENHSLTDEEVNDLIAISQERLNVYGLSDVQLKKVSDLSGNNYMLVEIAGSSPEDLQNLIAQQGNFEAKIGNQTTFIGGNKDITYVGRTGQDAMVFECFQVQEGEACNFRFVIYLSEEAAKRQADITSNLSINISSGGQYLDKKLDMYLDGKLVDSLNIGIDLKGKVATQIQISGSGIGATRQEAIDTTKLQMKKLQTVLITGSLPFKLQIVKTDKISPVLGENFTKQILISALAAILAVSLIIFIRYRKIKISISMIFVLLSEILIILGVASLIKWNLDLPSIAGIIAAIGTGVDDQIVILDESRRSKEQSIKQRIKNALFIILTAYATTAVSLLPLYWAGAGLLKGFAVTTLIGITAGVFITRPAFADIIKQMEQ